MRRLQSPNVLAPALTHFILKEELERKRYLTELRELLSDSLRRANLVKIVGEMIDITDRKLKISSCKHSKNSRG